MHFVYIIKNDITGKRYVGETSNIERRMLFHNKLVPVGAKSYTARQLGRWNVIHIENYPDRISALAREKWLKTGKGRDFIRKFILSS